MVFYIVYGSPNEKLGVYPDYDLAFNSHKRIYEIQAHEIPVTAESICKLLHGSVGASTNY